MAQDLCLEFLVSILVSTQTLFLRSRLGLRRFQLLRHRHPLVGWCALLSFVLARYSGRTFDQHRVVTQRKHY